MKYKAGDVAWYKKLGCKCVIEEAHSAPLHPSYYRISYVGSKVVRYQKAVPDDLSDYLVHCPICGKNLPVLNGLVDSHPKDGPLCYGSYLPQK